VFSTEGLTDDQLHAMWHACSDIARGPDGREALRRLSERVSQILAAPTLVFRREVSPWRLVARTSAPGEQKDPGAPTLDDLDRIVPTASDYLPPLLHGDQPWTPVALDEELPGQALLLLPGDWRRGVAAAWLPRFARTASIALRLATTRRAAQRGQAIAAEIQAFARRLASLAGTPRLHPAIVEAAAQAAGARLGGLAVYEPKKGALVVSATYGYPSEAAGQVRILPGAGIIGGVFSSKKPLLVRDTTRVPGLSARPRYQTASFMAVPIVGGEDALGVITLADRVDGRPFSRANLGTTRVIAAVAALALLREGLAAMADELAHTAAIDPLTTLFNRRYLHTRLDAELERSRRLGLPVALLMIDVDTFKEINDRLGHQTGDAVLRKVSEIIKRSVRASDVCTRYGGDEFAVIVPENASTATQTAERIRQRVASFRWEALGIPPSQRVTLSVGVALSELGEAPHSLLGRADARLYEAKARGRNRVVPAGG